MSNQETNMEEEVLKQQESEKKVIPVQKLKENRITVSQLEKKPFFLYGVIFIAFIFMLILFPFMKKEDKKIEPPVTPPVVDEPQNQNGSIVCIKNTSNTDFGIDSTIVFYYTNNQLDSVNENYHYTIFSEDTDELDKIKLDVQNMDSILKDETGYRSTISDTNTTYIYDYTIDLSKLTMKEINQELPIDERIDFPYFYKQNISKAKQSLIDEGYVCY